MSAPTSAPAPTPAGPMPPPAPVLEARALATGHGRHIVSQGIDFALGRAQVLCLLGANGCGKTTLLRTLLGMLAPLAGQVLVAGQPVRQWPRSAFARHVGYVPQAHAGLFPFTVEDVVLMGRAAYVGRFSTPGQSDRALALRCLESMGVAHLRHKIYTHISGGERQLTLIARALAQEPLLLVMDEPTASLDFGNQIRVLEHIERLRQGGMSVLMSTHQPEHALRVADRIALLGKGQMVAVGPAASTATAPALAALYGVSEAAVAACLGSVRAACAASTASTTSAALAGPDALAASDASDAAAASAASAAFAAAPSPASAATISNAKANANDPGD